MVAQIQLGERIGTAHQRTSWAGGFHEASADLSGR